MWKVFLMLSVASLFFPIKICSATQNSHMLNIELQRALLAGQDNESNSNLEVLADTFFPSSGSQPLCVVFQYSLLCDDALGDADTWKEQQCIQGYHPKYLWTEQSVTIAMSMFLFCYSNLFGRFGLHWDYICSLSEIKTLILPTEEVRSYNRYLIDESLEALTAQLKGIAYQQEIPKPINTYKGHSLNWTVSEKYFRRSQIVFTFQVALISILAVVLSLTLSDVAYRLILRWTYDQDTNIAISPGQPLLWGIVAFSILWNIGPGWMILPGSLKIVYSLVVVIPAQLLVAVFVKKSRKFITIRGGENEETGALRSFNPKVCKCQRYLIDHIIQVMAVWSLMITFTFVLHYIPGILVALYINFESMLAKLLFVKAAIYIFVFSFAILFRNLQFERTSWLNNVFIVTATFSILLIVVYLLLMLADVIYFSKQNASTKLLTLIPAAVVVAVTWYYRHMLLPKYKSIPLTPPKDGTENL